MIITILGGWYCRTFTMLISWKNSTAKENKNTVTKALKTESWLIAIRKQ